MVLLQQRHTPRSTGPSPRCWNATNATVAIVASSIVVGSTPLFLRSLGASGQAPEAMAFHRYVAAAVVLGPLLRFGPAVRRATLWGLGAGAVSGLGWAAFARSIVAADVGTTAVTYMTYPLFTMLWCVVVFRQRLGRRTLTAGALVVVAAVIAVRPTEAALPLELFAAPAAFGFSIAVLTERLHVLDARQRLASVAVGAAAVLVPVVARLPAGSVIPGDPESWFSTLFVSVACALAPMLLYGAAAPTLGAARSAVASTAELPMMLVVSAMAFGEPLLATHLGASALIFCAVAVAPAPERSAYQYSS